MRMIPKSGNRFSEKIMRREKRNAAFTKPDRILRKINSNATKRAPMQANIAPPPTWFTNRCFFQPVVGAVRSEPFL
jgi:hypothetical protein